ncbi:hypothetical protein ACFQU2_04755 [Siccirubricoccus deserti]
MEKPAMADEARFVEHAFDGDVHILRIANAPVNTLRTEVRAGLLDGLQAALREGAKAIVLIGSGRNFSAGAEMTEFGKPRKPPSLNEVFDAIENSRCRSSPPSMAMRWAAGLSLRSPAMLGLQHPAPRSGCPR